VAVLGVALGVQAAGLALALSGSAAAGFGDRDVEIGYGIYLGLAPAAGAGIGAAIAKGSRYYDVPLGSMMLGGYLGAALSYLGVALFMERDDPEADGEYDGGYFEDNAGGTPLLGTLALGLSPILLPAAGIAIGYVLGRDVKARRPATTWISMSPPSFTVFAPPRKGQPCAPGIALRATF
jgi:hypothetical protein